MPVFLHVNVYAVCNLQPSLQYLLQLSMRRHGAKLDKAMAENKPLPAPLPVSPAPRSCCCCC